jgi:hypothetical protein
MLGPYELKNAPIKFDTLQSWAPKN